MGVRSEQLRGTRFGAYEVVRLVGHGATASVFEATHLSLDKPVAIKLLHEHLAADPQITSRFVREGRVAARLQHPNIVNVLDVGTDRGVPYLVMELLTGGDLRSLLADVGVLSLEHALAFLLPILSALSHAHTAGVIHRDIKPANIFLARDARDAVVPKLVDFGLSKLVSAGGEMTSSLTSTGLIAGTVLYMAPEQTLGVRNSSAASDQYSLAAILYEAVTGKPAFSGDGVYALLEQIRSAPIPPPSTLNPKLPQAFDAVLLRAMQTDPSKRWASARAFGRELLPFADEETAEAFARDFTDPSSELVRVSSSRPSIRNAVPRVAPHEETRIERPDPAESKLVERPSAKPAVERAPDARPGGAPAGERPSGTSVVWRAEPLPCAPGMGPFHIKGRHFKSFMLHVGRALGTEKFLAKLEDPRLVSFVTQPFLEARSYDIFPFVPLFATLARMSGVPFEALVRTTSVAQAQYDAKTAYRLIFDPNRPEAIAERIGRFNTQIYDFGRFTALTPEKNHVTLVFEGIPAYIEPWFEPMHVAYGAECLRASGAREVDIVSHTAEAAGSQRGYRLRTYKTLLRWSV